MSQSSRSSVSLSGAQNGLELFQLAARDGEVETLERILLSNPNLDINTPTSDDFSSTTALHLAAHASRIEILRFLISFQFEQHNLTPLDLNVIDGRGRSPFALTIEAGNIDCARVFLQDERSRLDVHACAEKFRGATHPLILAARAQQRECVEFLVDECNVDPRFQTPTGLTVLAVAAQTGNVPLIDYILRCGLTNEEVNAPMDDGTDALYWAVVKDNIIVAEKLINHGADGLLKRDKDSRTSVKSIIKSMMAKDSAVKGRWLDLVFTLISRDKTGALLCDCLTTIKYNSQKRNHGLDLHVRDLRFFLDRGLTDGNQFNKTFERAIRRAVDEQLDIHPKIYAMFRAPGASESATSQAAEDRTDRIVQTRAIANYWAGCMREHRGLYTRLLNAMKDALTSYHPISDDIALALVHYQRNLSPPCDEDDDIMKRFGESVATCICEDKSSVEWAWFMRYIFSSAVWYEEFEEDEPDDEPDLMFDKILLKQCQETLRTEELKLAEEVTIQYEADMTEFRALAEKQKVRATISSSSHTPIGTPRMTPRFQSEEKTFSFGGDDEDVLDEEVVVENIAMKVTLSKVKFEVENFRRQDELIFSNGPDARPIGFMPNRTAMDLRYDVDRMSFYDKNVNLRDLIALGKQINDEFQMYMEDDVLSDILAEGNASFRSAPVKTLQRCQQKIDNEFKEEYYPQCARLLDIVRCSVVLASVADVERTIQVIQQSVDEFQQLIRTINERQARGETIGRQVAIGLIDVARIKNGFSAIPPQSVGDLDSLRPIPYADVTVNGVFLSHRVQKAMIVEVKLILRPFLDTKKETARLYSVFRDMDIYRMTRNVLEVKENITERMVKCIRRCDAKGLADLITLRLPVEYYALKEALKDLSKKERKREFIKSLVSQCK